MENKTISASRPETEAAPAAVLRPEEIRSYLAALTAKGRSPATVQMYAARLRALYDFLPPDKRLSARGLALWREELLDRGYSPGTVNIHLTAANGLLDHMGRRDLQLLGQLDVVPEIQPELTRAEYLRLLQAAKGLSRERSYLLVKAFALTGIRVGELERVTAEAVKEGRLLITADGEQRYVPLPNCLRRELLDYLDRQRIRDGPVFVTRSGRPLRRTQVTVEIQALCRDACVEESKGSPRCLRRLYQADRARLEASVRLLVEQARDRLLEEEQLTVGWDR